MQPEMRFCLAVRETGLLVLILPSQHLLQNDGNTDRLETEYEFQNEHHRRG